jgi:hypothetical protein
MSNKPSLIVTPQSASLDTRHAGFYYGGERVTGNGEWCFVATLPAEFGQTEPKEIVIPFSKLRADEHHMEDVVSCLLTGIGWIFAKYRLELS